MRLIGKLLALPLRSGYGDSLSGVQISCGALRRCAGVLSGIVFLARWRCSLQPGSGRGFPGW